MVWDAISSGRLTVKGKVDEFTCDEKCECENKKENWNCCVVCGRFNCDLGAKKEDGWDYSDEKEEWTCSFPCRRQKATGDESPE